MLRLSAQWNQGRVCGGTLTSKLLPMPRTLRPISVSARRPMRLSSRRPGSVPNFRIRRNGECSGSKYTRFHIPFSAGVRPVKIAGMIPELKPSRVRSGCRWGRNSAMNGRSRISSQPMASISTNRWTRLIRSPDAPAHPGAAAKRAAEVAWAGKAAHCGYGGPAREEGFELRARKSAAAPYRDKWQDARPR